MKRAKVPKKNESQESEKKTLKQQKLPFLTKQSDSSENAGAKGRINVFSVAKIIIL